jgi:hypothetical protein
MMFFGVEESRGECLGQFGLAHARGAEEYERADRARSFMPERVMMASATS